MCDLAPHARPTFMNETDLEHFFIEKKERSVVSNVKKLAWPRDESHVEPGARDLCGHIAAGRVGGDGC
eukprot:1143309-Pleurochrysis_carterae.AAC.1